MSPLMPHSAGMAASRCGIRQLTRQSGQALVLSVLLAALGALAMWRYFGAGQAVADKARLVHTADTAAYSGALVQARALNMLALLNRTQLAHQLAMAHLVTLGSWAMLGGTEAVRAGMGNPPVYLIGMLFGAAHGQAYAAALPAVGMDVMAREGTGQLAQAYARHESLVHDLLAVVQQDITAGLPGARLAAIQHIVTQQFGDAMTQVHLEEDAWPAYLQALAPERLAHAVNALAGQYAFLSPRNHTERNGWMVQARCPTRRHELRRRGQTQLNSEGIWESIDTQSYHALRANRWVACYYREYEMAWGWVPPVRGEQAAVTYTEQAPDDFSLQDFWRWVQAHAQWGLLSQEGNPLANSRAYAQRARWPGRGLPSLLDTPGASWPAVRFQLRLLRPGSGGFTYQAKSAAESYFRRPLPRADALAEPVNLFRPYWQARLASMPDPAPHAVDGGAP